MKKQAASLICRKFPSFLLQNFYPKVQDANFQRFPSRILANFMGVVYISKLLESHQWPVISNQLRRNVFFISFLQLITYNL